MSTFTYIALNEDEIKLINEAEFQINLTVETQKSWANKIMHARFSYLDAMADFISYKTQAEEQTKAAVNLDHHLIMEYEEKKGMEENSFVIKKLWTLGGRRLDINLEPSIIQCFGEKIAGDNNALKNDDTEPLLQTMSMQLPPLIRNNSKTYLGKEEKNNNEEECESENELKPTFKIKSLLDFSALLPENKSEADSLINPKQKEKYEQHLNNCYAQLAKWIDELSDPKRSWETVLSRSKLDGLDKPKRVPTGVKKMYDFCLTVRSSLAQLDESDLSLDEKIKHTSDLMNNLKKAVLKVAEEKVAEWNNACFPCMARFFSFRRKSTYEFYSNVSEKFEETGSFVF